MTKVETVRVAFDGYLSQDRDRVDRLLAGDFVSQELVHVVPTYGADVFVDGARNSNATVPVSS